MSKYDQLFIDDEIMINSNSINSIEKVKLMHIL